MQNYMYLHTPDFDTRTFQHTTAPQSLKRKGHQGDCLGLHRGCWSLLSTSPISTRLHLNHWNGKVFRVTITMTSQWPRWRLKSPAYRLFTQRFVQVQIKASLAFVRGIRRWPVNSQHKGPVTRKMFPFHGVIMCPGLHTGRWKQALISTWRPAQSPWLLSVFVIPLLY